MAQGPVSHSTARWHLDATLGRRVDRRTTRGLISNPHPPTQGSLGSRQQATDLPGLKAPPDRFRELTNPKLMV
jgi:hypothetical protein